MKQNQIVVKLHIVGNSTSHLWFVFCATSCGCSLLYHAAFRVKGPCEVAFYYLVPRTLPLLSWTALPAQSARLRQFWVPTMQQQAPLYSSAKHAVLTIASPNPVILPFQAQISKSNDTKNWTEDRRNKVGRNAFFLASVHTLTVCLHDSYFSSLWTPAIHVSSDI